MKKNIYIHKIFLYINNKKYTIYYFIIGNATEMVFISPFFYIINLPDMLDSFIWLLPPIVIRISYPILQ
jgi:hypothetical protein